jgi:hypothetical protein
MLANPAAEPVRLRVIAAVEKAGDDSAALARIADHLAATITAHDKEQGQ